MMGCLGGSLCKAHDPQHALRPTERRDAYIRHEKIGQRVYGTSIQYTPGTFLSRTSPKQKKAFLQLLRALQPHLAATARGHHAHKLTLCQPAAHLHARSTRKTTSIPEERLKTPLELVEGHVDVADEVERGHPVEGEHHREENHIERELENLVE